jgi:hypothetical protein
MIVFNDTYFIMLFIARAHVQTELVCVWYWEWIYFKSAEKLSCISPYVPRKSCEVTCYEFVVGGGIVFLPTVRYR